MKKLTIITLMTLLIFGAADTFAQGFGVKGSFNMFNLSVKVNDDKLDTKMFPTFDAGIFYEVPLAPEFFLRPEVSFAQKGANYELDILGMNVLDEEIRLSYIEVPILFLYKGGLGNSKILLGFGPYLAYGIAGEMFENDVYKPFDMGGKIMFGLEFGGGLSAALNASTGLIDIGEDDNDDLKITNSGFGLTLGYRFGGR